MKRAWLFATLLLTFAFSAFAQTIVPVPPLMNFSGRLSKPDGSPVSDGVYSVRFSLWDAATNGTEKWNQTLNVTAKNGTFAALLSGFSETLFYGNLWMEIKIGAATPLAPRQQLLSVPYAFKANTVGTLTGNGSNIGIGTTQPTSALSIVTNNTTSPLSIAASTVSPAFLTGWQFRKPISVVYNGSPVPDYPVKLTLNTTGLGSFADGRDLRFTTAESTNPLPYFIESGYGSANTIVWVKLPVLQPGTQTLFMYYGNALATAMSNPRAVFTFYDDFTDAAYTLNNWYIIDSSPTYGGGSLLLHSAEVHVKNLLLRDNAVDVTFRLNGTNSSQEAIDFYGLPARPRFSNTSGVWTVTIPRTSTFNTTFTYSGSANSWQNATFVARANSLAIFVNGALLTIPDYPEGYFFGVPANPVGLYGRGSEISMYRVRKAVDSEPAVSVGSQQSAPAAALNSVVYIQAGNGFVGIGTEQPAYKLHVNGSMAATTFATLSDARYKTRMAPLADPLETIFHLRGVAFDWKRAEDMDFPDSRQIGFIAQEVEKILPELVMTDKNGVKSVNYLGVVPVLVEAVKAQNKRAETLSKENAALKARLERIEAVLAELKANK